MSRTILPLTCLVLSLGSWASDKQQAQYPSFDYRVAQVHEIKPHRRTIPLKGVGTGFNQLHIMLTVSSAGDVIDASATGDKDALKFWDQVRDEALRWKFIPFESNGTAVTANVEEYIDLVPPERFPKNHVFPPSIRPDSRVVIVLQRSGCYGSCPSYMVTISTDTGIVFEGRGFVAASGRHTDRADADDVRKLAKKFVAADFYSMDPSYRAGVTDNPTYVLSIAIDGHAKKVEDYVGSWEGMPAVITELEDEVDEFARTDRWIGGSKALVPALQSEGFNFKSFEAQVMLKEAADRGETATVRELIEAGVPLDPLPAPKPKERYMSAPFQDVGWLSAASNHRETLRLLIDVGASKNDQDDKDLALVGAARSGDVEAARALIAYGANPNADLRKQNVTESSGFMRMGGKGAGSVLIYAAESGNPDMVREILRYHPKLEARDGKGRTAVFAVGESRSENGDPVECLRLLVEAGADVNARDTEGNTPLHEIDVTEVEEELLELGADVNARNSEGETPIFTTVDDDAIPLLVAHGADLSIRNNNGETVMEAATKRSWAGPARLKALRKAADQLRQR